MGPRALLPMFCAVLVLAGAGARSLVALAFVSGVLLGAMGALVVAWYAMTPTFRQLVRASIAARRGT